MLLFSSIMYLNDCNYICACFYTCVRSFVMSETKVTTLILANVRIIENNSGDTLVVIISSIR
jgi:hypothetical protein